MCGRLRVLGGRPPVNQFLLQYFVNYNLKKGWYTSSSPTPTPNWRASSASVWTVPFGGGISKITKLGFQPVNLQATFYGQRSNRSLISQRHPESG